MDDVPDFIAVGSWLVGFFWASAALCYFYGDSNDVAIELFLFGILVALSKWYLRRHG